MSGPRYAIQDKATGKFCFFGSYRTIRLVDKPWDATLYVNKARADAKMDRAYHMLGDKRVLPSELRIAKMMLTYEVL